MIEKIYIIHYKYLEDRKIYLDEKLRNIKVPYEFIINDKQSDSISLENVNKYYIHDSNIHERHLTKGEICLSISHFDVYKKILEDNNINKNILIIEDDALFSDDLLERVSEIINELTDDYDMCFISECCNLHANKIDGKIIYPSKTSRCVTGYIVNKKCLNLVVNTLPFQYPIDWHLNYINEKLNLKYFWSEPCVISQGSESVYKSNLR
jgi:GR25 family glycosyltransferase involved in LPS biosynthesis